MKANGGQAVELSFTAKIKAGANLSAYVKEDGRTQKVPANSRTSTRVSVTEKAVASCATLVFTLYQ
ncbi:hypothetical protein V470_11035 [Streptococcus sp. VT 162]|nr:hypothetical protein V470_11035 [Streptococcus sp. VT 162]